MSERRREVITGAVTVEGTAESIIKGFAVSSDVLQKGLEVNAATERVGLVGRGKAREVKAGRRVGQIVRKYGGLVT